MLNRKSKASECPGHEAGENAVSSADGGCAARGDRSALMKKYDKMRGAIKRGPLFVPQTIIVHFKYPTGIPHHSPGLGGTSYPGNLDMKKEFYLNEVVSEQSVWPGR